MVLTGDNAQGKTNTLEAIYLLATLKPLRARRHRDLIRWGEDGCAVAGRVSHLGTTRRYRLDLAEGARTVSLDGERVSDLGQYFEGIRAIAFTPQDAAIVADEPRGRRSWIDRAAFTARPVHLQVARTYKRLLDQKSATLRSERRDRAVLDVLDEQLARAGAELADRRERMLRELEPHVQRVHRDIAGGSGGLSLRYRTEAAGSDVAFREAVLAERLLVARPEELRRQRTLVGPQLDDVTITLDGRSARTFGSQGQVRSVVLSLKLGELVAAKERGDAPLFLLDDVSSELDAHRTARLVGVLEELGVQVFATTTDPGQLTSLPREDTLQVRVRQGVLRAA